ncbi:hypothetical protein L1887_36332 [Cichorium endivia]|nr:hypothetical protein L1887_36332 [Cichorium endivia]
MATRKGGQIRKTTSEGNNKPKRRRMAYPLTKFVPSPIPTPPLVTITPPTTALLSQHQDILNKFNPIPPLADRNKNISPLSRILPKSNRL